MSGPRRCVQLGVRAGSRWQHELVRACGLVECWRPLLSECAGNTAPENVTHCDAPNSAMRFTQSRDAGHGPGNAQQLRGDAAARRAKCRPTQPSIPVCGRSDVLGTLESESAEAGRQKREASGGSDVGISVIRPEGHGHAGTAKLRRRGGVRTVPRGREVGCAANDRHAGRHTWQG